MPWGRGAQVCRWGGWPAARICHTGGSPFVRLRLWCVAAASAAVGSGLPSHTAISFTGRVAKRFLRDNLPVGVLGQGQCPAGGCLGVAPVGESLIGCLHYAREPATDSVPCGVRRSGPGVRRLHEQRELIPPLHHLCPSRHLCGQAPPSLCVPLWQPGLSAALAMQHHPCDSDNAPPPPSPAERHHSYTCISRDQHTIKTMHHLSLVRCWSTSV